MNTNTNALRNQLRFKKINADKNFNAGTKNYTNHQCYDLPQTSEIELEIELYSFNERAFTFRAPLSPFLPHCPPPTVKGSPPPPTTEAVPSTPAARSQEKLYF